MFQRTDVSSEADVKALAAFVKARFGHADILVNNAALFAELPKVDFREIPVETFDRVMAVNVRGPFLMAQHIAPLMIPRGRGKIINIASGTAYKGQRNLAAYVTSKGAVVSMTKALARDLGADKINVNSIAPGFTESASVHDNPHQKVNAENTVKSRALAARAGAGGSRRRAVVPRLAGERLRDRPDDRGGRRLDHAVSVGVRYWRVQCMHTYRHGRAGQHVSHAKGRRSPRCCRGTARRGRSRC